VNRVANEYGLRPVRPFICVLFWRSHR
jgi:hypothetical protein